MKKLRSFSLLLSLGLISLSGLLILNGCGQKGPLYLPKTTPTSTSKTLNNPSTLSSTPNLKASS